MVAIAFGVALSTAAPAQESAKDRKDAAVLEEARQHVAKAKVHYDLGEFQQAAEEYIIVYRLRAIPALLFNIAQAYRQGGDYEKAKQFYKAYLRESPNLKNKSTIEQAIREIDELLAKTKKAKDSPPTGVAAEPVPGPQKPLPIPGTPPSQPKEPVAAVAPPAVGKPPASGTSSAPSTQPPSPSSSSGGKATTALGPAPSRSEKTTVDLARPSTQVGSPLFPADAPRRRTWTWVAAGGSATALVVGAAFGLKTIDGASKSDAQKANILYGIGGALAVLTAALFVYEF
jgi:tetratricopeptide (TPR) repeat protein